MVRHLVARAGNVTTVARVAVIETADPSEAIVIVTIAARAVETRMVTVLVAVTVLTAQTEVVIGTIEAGAMTVQIVADVTGTVAMIAAGAVIEAATSDLVGQTGSASPAGRSTAGSVPRRGK